MSKRKKIPQSIINEMVKLGADFEEGFKEDLCRISITFGDSAWAIYDNWEEHVFDNYGILAIFSPSDGIYNSIICPDINIGFSIQREVNSLIYEVLNSNSLNTNPVLPIYCEKSKSLSCILQEIKSPPENYPTLSNLQSGMYICHIHQIWKNGVVVINVLKS